MTTTNQPKPRPTHRISFCARLGADAQGNDRLGPPREVGAVWPRKNAFHTTHLRDDDTGIFPSIRKESSGRDC